MIDISDRWKQIILTMPDNYFFELMKNYLGKIETPFNKHKLVDRLGNFLVQQKADKKILSRLTEKEIIILTAIEFISKPSARTIYEFFLGDIPFIELCDTLKTLEEKLIIFSDRAEIHLSPIFEQDVRESIINPGLLYKSEEYKPGTGVMIWLTDGLLLSFLSLLFHQKDLLKSSGAFKKRAYNHITRLYPQIFSNEEGEKRLELMRRIVHNLKLFRIDGNNLIPRDEIWSALMELSRGDLFCYLVAAATTEHIMDLGDRVSTVKRIITALPENRAFFTETLKKLIKALNLDKSMVTNVDVTSFMDDLITMKILIPLKDGMIAKNPILDLGNLNPDYGDKQTIIVQPNFDIALKPWVTLKDGYNTALFSTLKKMDLYTEFSITKESVIRGLTVNQLKSFTKSLEDVSGKLLPDNITLTLEEWEKESKKVMHYEASVLLLDEDKEFILKETGVVDDLILLNPTKGVYLFTQENYRLAKPLLEEVDIIPLDKSSSISTNIQTLPVMNNKPIPEIDWEEKVVTINNSDRLRLYNRLKKISPTKEEQEDLKKRIDRGIIFSEDQIQRGITKSDFMEAKGINYQAKLRLIEVSLKSANDRLEINSVDDNFEIKKELILPEKLEKNGELRILHGQRLPQEEPYSIDISKISLVKRIQSTLF